MLDGNQFEALTFDCYGTLVDWEQGILMELSREFEGRNIPFQEEKLLEEYAEFEAELERGEFQNYRTILQEVMLRFGEKYGFTCTKAERNQLVNSLPNWKLFPDTVPALRRLRRRYTLNIVSNIDTDLFAMTQRRLKFDFATLTTAQEVGSYKPSPRNFEVALKRIGLPKERVLHVAQSLYHDIAPAKVLGLKTVWVNRRKGKDGFGATPPADAQPDFEVPDLQTLADLLEEKQP